jgi:hypothetical protein
MAMKPRAMKKKMMRGGAVKKPAAKRMQSGGVTSLPVGLPKRSRKSNTQAFNDRTELNRKAQAVRAAGPAVNETTAKKRAIAAAALKSKRDKAAAALKSKRDKAAAALKSKRDKAAAALKRKRTNASKPVVKKPVVKKPSKSGTLGYSTITMDEGRVAKMRGGGLKKK